MSKLSLTGLASFPRPHCVRLSAIALQSSLSTQAFGNGSLRKKRKFFFSSLDKIWKGRGWLWSKEDRLSSRFRQTWPLAKVQIYSMCLLSFRALDTGDQWPIVITINSNMLFTAPAILLKFTFLCIGILPETKYFLLAFYRYFRENLDLVIFLRPRWQPCNRLFLAPIAKSDPWPGQKCKNSPNSILLGLELKSILVLRKAMFKVLFPQSINVYSPIYRTR